MESKNDSGSPSRASPSDNSSFKSSLAKPINSTRLFKIENIDEQKSNSGLKVGTTKNANSARPCLYNANTMKKQISELAGNPINGFDEY